MRTLVNCILLITILSANAQSPRLWGMTGAFNQIEFGTIFSINLDGSDHQIEYVFSQSSGYQARGALCLAPNGKLYGMTSQGGIYGNGTLFSFDPSTQQFNKILDCDYGAIGPSWVTLLLASDGYLYGAGASNIFRLDPATDEYTFHAGYSTNEGFMQTPDGLIYGSETYGGFNGAFGPGLIYRFDPVTLQVEELHAFSEQDGAQPYARLCHAANGKLYGMTGNGGSLDEGVVYEYDPIADQFTVLENLIGTNGASPFSGFIALEPDLLIGTTPVGGEHDEGIICTLQPSTGTYTVVHSFEESAQAFGGLLQASNGWLYGMTVFGGTNGIGTIYRVDPTTYAVTFIFDLPGGHLGHTPHAELIEVGGGVGITEPAKVEVEMNVSPNPARSSTKLMLGSASPGPWTISLTDVLGKLIWSRDIDSHTQMIELPEVSGVYLLTAIGAEASGVTRIVVE